MSPHILYTKIEVLYSGAGWLFIRANNADLCGDLAWGDHINIILEGWWEEGI